MAYEEYTKNDGFAMEVEFGYKSYLGSISSKFQGFYRRLVETQGFN
jgi:hypothetical protein